uniref:FHA domain-containing protein n=1 Tax=Desertifilum tharense IPPAS B-1220 TaxID=1781255 RepID=A0ACD5GV61_9CYAN
MNELTLEWQEGSQLRQEIISQHQPSKHPGTIRLGRDPAQCDIVLSHPTVSGLHIEIFFSPPQDSFKVRNLRGESNPPMIDGQLLPEGEQFLSEGSTIQLGQMLLRVTEISSGVPPTVIMPPKHPSGHLLPHLRSRRPQPPNLWAKVSELRSYFPLREAKSALRELRSFSSECGKRPDSSEIRK